MINEEYDPIPPFATTPVDPPAGYGHALTIDEIVGRLIGYKPQEMPYDEVLDAAIEQAGFEHHKAEIAGAAADRLEALQARINHLGRRRRDAINFDRELKEAAEGWPAQHLKLSNKEYPDGVSRFITTSVYYWAREEVLEWAPSALQPLAEGDAPPISLAAVTQIAPETPANRPSHPETAHQNLRITVHIVAQALASLIDQLALQRYISFSAEHTCIGEQQSVNVDSLCDYLTSAPDLPLETLRGENSEVTQDFQDPQDITLLALKVLAMAFANLAQQALDNGWIAFRRGNREIGGGEIDTRPFRTPTKIFVSKRLYDYLDWKEKIPAECQGQRERAILQRLGDAKGLGTGDGRPPVITQTQLQRVLVRAFEAFATRDEP